MKYFQKISSALCLTALLLLPQLAPASEDEVKMDALAEVQEQVQMSLPEGTLAKAYYTKPDTTTGTYKDQWKPYMASNNMNRPVVYPFFQTNIGFGLLRFSGVKGGLARATFPYTLARDNGIQGRIDYSRSPLVEIILGYSIKNWFQFGLSYQHQGDIQIQTKPQPVPTVPGIGICYGQFISSLKLDAFAAKCYFFYPSAMVMKCMSYSWYLGMGTGPAWQSWTNMHVYSFDYLPNTTAVTITDNFTVKNKYCCNWFFMFDLGVKARSVIPNRNFSVSFGCKYNEWGQARNLGNQQQNANYLGVGFDKPISIKVIYQFAPYIGFELDF